MKMKWMKNKYLVVCMIRSKGFDIPYDKGKTRDSDLQLNKDYLPPWNLSMSTETFHQVTMNVYDKQFKMSSVMNIL